MNRRLDPEVEAVARIGVVPAILDVVCKVTGMGFSAVARVTGDRWIACAVKDSIHFGLQPGGELQLETTICNEVRTQGRLIAIDDVAEDPLYRDHPTPRIYGFQSYISVPIRLENGEFFGTLCAIGPNPARVRKPETITMLELFANLIALHLEAQDRLATSETALSDERHRTELQDQFIAVLGHDLRNPLSAIQTGAKVLLTMAPTKPIAHVATVIDRSASRITGIVDNVLDFAQGRLGGGLTMHRVPEERLGAALEQVVSEMRMAQPDRVIDARIDLPGPIYCDGARLAQLLSNLL
ncbi:MAG: GAF domain-containing sensor histidine kinase, partial [Vicinamibacterales bacterium]